MDAASKLCSECKHGAIAIFDGNFPTKSYDEGSWSQLYLNSQSHNPPELLRPFRFDQGLAGAQGIRFQDNSRFARAKPAKRKNLSRYRATARAFQQLATSRIMPWPVVAKLDIRNYLGGRT
jgi:hypothetical protein